MIERNSVLTVRQGFQNGFCRRIKITFAFNGIIKRAVIIPVIFSVEADQAYVFKAAVPLFVSDGDTR